MRPPHGLAIYVRNCHYVVSTHKVSTKQLESVAIDVMNSHSSSVFSIIVVYKAPSCRFEDLKKQLMSLSQLRLSEKLIIIGDFNFNVQNDQNTNFLKAMNAVPRAKKLNTASTTSENTVLDIAFTSCNNAQSDVITCVWSYHHTLVTSCYSQDIL